MHHQGPIGKGLPLSYDCQQGLNARRERIPDLKSLSYIIQTIILNSKMQQYVLYAYGLLIEPVQRGNANVP